MRRTWEKLDLLRKSCDTELRSFLDADGNLAWRVTLTHRALQGPAIIVTRTELQEAVSEAVAEAERRGWISN